MTTELQTPILAAARELAEAEPLLNRLLTVRDDAALPSTHPDRQCLDRAIAHLDARCTALQDAVLTSEPRGLEDAVGVAAVALERADAVSDEAAVEILAGALKSVARTIASYCEDGLAADWVSSWDWTRALIGEQPAATVKRAKAIADGVASETAAVAPETAAVAPAALNGAGAEA